MSEGADEMLEREKATAENLINTSKISNSAVLFPDSFFTIMVVPPQINRTFYSDTSIYDKLEKESVGYRVIKSYYNHNEKTYLITILKPALEEDELMEGLVSSLFVVIGLLILSFLIVNWILSKLLWKSFYNTISLLNEYGLEKNKQLVFSPSNIKEFKELNETLIKMTDKIYADFKRQKEFTENASHELQTPLAVIKSKIELLIQSENLKEDEMQQIQTIESAVNKLSSLNKALLLLVKIENRQFNEVEKLSAQIATENILLNFDNLMRDKNILLAKAHADDFSIKINPQLLDILLANLLQNAIRHNFIGGTIKIEIIDHTLSVSNTGEVLKVKSNEMFERFKKDIDKKESLGIGLAIVKSICDIYGIDIEYSYKRNEHIFKLVFPDVIKHELVSK
ncbi:MAG TPA: HAMP domain-containing sensor histidine kinase [Hanamia sp.]